MARKRKARSRSKHKKVRHVKHKKQKHARHPRRKRRSRARKHAKSPNLLYPVAAIIIILALAALIPILAPIVTAPPGRFIFPLTSGSSSYNATYTPTAGSGQTAGGPYKTDIIVGQPVVETSSSSSYNATFGVESFILPTSVCGNTVIEDLEVCDTTDLAGATCASEVGSGSTGTISCMADCTAYDTSACTIPPNNPVPQNEAVTPSSNGTYTPGQSYTFSIEWLPTGGTTIDEVVFRLFQGGQLVGASRTLSGGGVTAAGDVYSTTYTELAAGTYIYDWFARDSLGRTRGPSGVEFTYVINKANTTTTMTLNGAADNITVDPGDEVTVVVTSSPSLPVSLAANFTNGLATVQTGNGSLTYTFNTTQVGGANWLLRGTTPSNENYTTSQIDRTVKLRAPTQVVLTINGQSISQRDPTVGVNFATINASMPANEEVCVNITKPDGSMPGTTPCGTPSVQTDEFLDQTGLWTFTGFFAGTPELEASSATLYMSVGDDTTPPQITGFTQSATQVGVGGSITVGADVSDSNGFIDMVILQTNETGTFQDVASQSIQEPSATVSFTFTASIEGNFSWRLVANDAANNEVNSTAQDYAVLPPGTAVLSFITDPPGAEITIGTDVIGTAAIDTSVVAGTYTISFQPLPTYATPPDITLQINQSDLDTTLVINVTYYDPNDANQNRVMEISELTDTIDLWRAGTISITELATAIDRWKLAPGMYP